VWKFGASGCLLFLTPSGQPRTSVGCHSFFFVIFSGAVYSYIDLLTYGIWDISYQPPATPEGNSSEERLTSSRIIFETYGLPDNDSPFWQAISLSKNLSYLSNPIQIHHAENDQVVNIGYSFDLAAELQIQGKPYEFYIYKGGGHNIISPFFDQAMERTVQFFQDNL
jgi:hypothetical protein